MIDRDRYQTEKDGLSKLVTVGAFRAWLEGLEKLTDDAGVKTGIRRWIDRVAKMEPAQSLVAVRDQVGNLYAIGINLLNQASGRKAEFGVSWADELMPEIKTDFQALYDAAQKKWAGVVQKDPEKYRLEATNFIEAMKATRTKLDAAKPLIQTPSDAARFNRLAAEYHGLMTRFAEQSQKETGFPIVLVVLGIGMSAAGLAWGVAAWEYAGGLRDRVSLELEELRARVEASKDGRVLQPSTLPAPPPAPKPGDGWGQYLWPAVGIGVLSAGAWYLTRKRGGRDD